MEPAVGGPAPKCQDDERGGQLLAVAKDHAALGHLDDLCVGIGSNARQAQALREQQRVPNSGSE